MWAFISLSLWLIFEFFSFSTPASLLLITLQETKDFNLSGTNLTQTIIIIIIIIIITVPKEYLRRTKKNYLKQLSSINFINGINTWAVPLVRCSGSFLKRSREELRQMDQRTRKLMTMHKALHPKDNVDRLYVPRKEGRRGLASIADSVDTSLQRLEDYIEKHKSGLITAIRNNTDNTMDNRMTKIRKQKWEEKQLHG